MRRIINCRFEGKSESEGEYELPQRFSVAQNRSSDNIACNFIQKRPFFSPPSSLVPDHFFQLYSPKSDLDDFYPWGSP